MRYSGIAKNYVCFPENYGNFLERLFLSTLSNSCFFYYHLSLNTFQTLVKDKIPNATDEPRNQSLEYHLILRCFCSRPLRIFHCGSWVFQSFNFLALDSGEIWLSIIRSSLPEKFCKNDALKNFLKFTVKYLFQSLFRNKFAGLRLLAKYIENFLPKKWYSKIISFTLQMDEIHTVRGCSVITSR